jgi:hypothetical protein
MRAICRSLVRTLPHQSLRAWGLLVRTLLIDRKRFERPTSRAPGFRAILAAIL